MPKREWKEVISPKFANDHLDIYRGTWLPLMDRCWLSNDGYSVMSRLIQTEWGKVEHVTIQIHKEGLGDFSSDGTGDIPWKVKQEIKNELFGEKRLAIEVFPKEKNLVDVCDVYHLWVFDKNFDLPFGLHPARDPQCKPINRGCSVNLKTIGAVSSTDKSLKITT